MPAEIRDIVPDQLAALRRTVAIAFGQDPQPAEEERDRRLLEFGRNRGAFDGNRLVGSAGAYSLDLTVPGGTVATAGISNVTVLPSHRRQGLMRNMMTELLLDARLRGDVLAALWSSETQLYGRFGFGVAGVTTHLTIDRFPLLPHRLAPPPAPVVIIDSEEAKTVLPSLFDRKRREVPGMFARSSDWWELEVFADYPRHRQNASTYRYAVALDSIGEAVGYVQYRTRGTWEGIGCEVTVGLEEMIALTPEAHSGLWSFLVNHDLIRKLRAWNISPGTALHHIFANFRESQKLNDGLWVRILDVEAALSARRYSVDGSLVIEVVDPIGNRASRFRLEVMEGVGACQASSQSPDLMLDMEDLSAGYLGRPRFRHLQMLGRVGGGYQSCALADAMFDWQPQPWCQEVF
jgi:predicted acetyltransferase